MEKHSCRQIKVTKNYVKLNSPTGTQTDASSIQILFTVLSAPRCYGTAVTQRQEERLRSQCSLADEHSACFFLHSNQH